MLCLKEYVNRYESVRLNQLFKFQDKQYIRLAMANVRVVDNGQLTFDSVCQEVHEDFSDLELRLVAKLSKIQTIKNANYVRIPMGQFGEINVDDGRKLFVQIAGVDNLSWNATDLNYYYQAKLIQPLSKMEINHILQQQRFAEIKKHYQATKNNKVVKLVLGRK